MGIGVFEILIIVLIIIVLFGGYKRLPSLGRSAGTGVRKGGEKAKQIAGQVQDKAGSVDTKKIGESVGKGLREARDVRDTVKGIAEQLANPVLRADVRQRVTSAVSAVRRLFDGH